ncbi:MAG: glycosyl hydrolase [Saprospiraceae bacterium]|nr:glycosyl hydrolase [Saprospiraceae bacterium]
MNKSRLFFLFSLLCIVHFSSAQIIPVGNGSYTTVFPGTDEAGRNQFPSGSPQLSGNALNKPVPTNDWWSKLVKENHADNLFNYPLSMKTLNDGLVIGNIVPVSTPNGSSQPFGDAKPIVVGVSDLNASNVTVSDHSDWTVTMNWNQGTHDFSALSGIGMPFVYFTKSDSDIAEIEVIEGIVTIQEETLIIKDSQSGSDYAVYGPSGSTWLKSGNTYTSNLNGQNYWSIAMLPNNGTDLNTLAEEYQKYAYTFPSNTTVSWNYDQSTSNVTSTFTVGSDIKEGAESEILLGLLPHQWGYLSAQSPQPNGDSYNTIRGELKMIAGNEFVVQHTFKGILPTLPYLDNYSPGFSPAQLNGKIQQLENDGLATWTDSYNEGQVMNRLIQTARIADEMGNIQSRDKIIATIKERLEDWLKYETGEVAFLYYYNDTWSSLIGYPAGHGQDANLNDHHFHWGYFIHAAAFIEQFVPGWSEEWGGMINLLIRDAASADRDDDQFPFLRNFSPYAGHSWANGFATFPFGNDQESTSESMQFASSLIHWGSITENDEIRDLGIYIYTTEQSACEEYWFDMNNRTFKDGYGYQLASRIWGNGYDNQTFWTSDIAAAYGIEMYPIHGGSLYLAHNQEYMQSLWNEISSNTGILSNEANDNLWHDTYWKYLSFLDPQAAIDLYDSYPDRNLKFGVSDAQTYHWLHAMNVLGTVNIDITANHPIAASFSKDGEIIYVAHNYSDEAIEVLFSDGFTLPVPANELVTSKDVDVKGSLTSDFQFAHPGGSVLLTSTIEEGTASKVEFFDGNTLLGEDDTEPFQLRAENLALGIHSMYAKVYVNNDFNNTNIINIQVGEQIPYESVFQIPGVIEAGRFDKFEGGKGQNISYLDISPGNDGNFRLDEDVDTELTTQEGAIIRSISSGEWLEYSIDVQTSGLYDVTFRYASDNSAGGGPFHFEVDGLPISSPVSMSSTNGWNTWSNKVLENVELNEGNHILRLVMTNGEFNLGTMTFEHVGALDYVAPIADAGQNVTVVLPSTTVNLDGSQSYDPEGEVISYAWEQIYGPSSVSYSDITDDQPLISNLEEGVYKFRLTVSDGQYNSYDEVLVIVSSDGNLPPSISITAPLDNTTFREGEPIPIETAVSDIDGFINLVEFFANDVKIGEDDTAPFAYQWENASVGSHIIIARATDNANTFGTSQEVLVEVAEVRSCSETSNTSQQGSFSTGYEATFETVGNNITITFTLLDTDKVGVVAYLWQESPFTEYEMTLESGLTFTKTFGGQTIGEEKSFACKFAFAGGLAVTKYITYEVGKSCMTSSSSDVLEEVITLSPNPTSDILYIDGLEQESKVDIYSSQGQQMFSATTTNSIVISDLPPGPYFIILEIRGVRIIKKFLKL